MKAALVLFVLTAPAVGQVPNAAPAVRDVDWRSSPLDLNLRGLDGERFTFRCPPGKAGAGQVVGSNAYADGSSICSAGVHAGAIRPASGGLVTVEIRPGASGFVGTLSHYVQSVSYSALWGGSFVVLVADGVRAKSPER